ncbi:type II toxin-antitoxin system mRNA interferase toxin, RelE/StbE family [Secundilactobacillus yichangensis]|uniref:type II toxin-antitoxin system mRNA interferase toxin, RelE/StbE family n=1 Tax=Secundilactobacillus yichangensis TaxID=2799580 RepID=UPI001945A0E1|nr:type II toxin-antitoxin system mRNA interferase toxin, RelE/StbE family [Secundilactobacillus yichangensis]
MKIKGLPTFKREFKKLKKKHYPVELVSLCLHAIDEQDAEILTQIDDHALHGNWAGYREFHPARYKSKFKREYDQWIVIYRIEHEELVLVLVATGDHSLLH